MKSVSLQSEDMTTYVKYISITNSSLNFIAQMCNSGDFEHIDIAEQMWCVRVAPKPFKKKAGMSSRPRLILVMTTL